MKKTKGILTGTLLVMALGMLTACGSNNNKADESGQKTRKKITLRQIIPKPIHGMIRKMEAIQIQIPVRMILL